jgi:hypothetical protein
MARQAERGMKIAALLVMVGLLNVGCATVVAPRPAGDCVAVYLTNYGRHSSVLVPSVDGYLNEYAYGDWDWFALNRVSLGGALRAMLFSRGATLGRRQLKVEDNIDALAHATNAVTVNRFLAPRERAQRLLAQLDEQYERELNTATYNSMLQMWFVRSSVHYSVLHNCNHATASWLKSLGCRIRGPVMLSAFKVRA